MASTLAVRTSISNGFEIKSSPPMFIASQYSCYRPQRIRKRSVLWTFYGFPHTSKSIIIRKFDIHDNNVRLKIFHFFCYFFKIAGTLYLHLPCCKMCATALAMTASSSTINTLFIFLSPFFSCFLHLEISFILAACLLSSMQRPIQFRIYPAIIFHPQSQP